MARKDITPASQIQVTMKCRQQASTVDTAQGILQIVPADNVLYTQGNVNITSKNVQDVDFFVPGQDYIITITPVPAA